MADINMRVLLSAAGGSSVTSAIQGIVSSIGGSGGLMGVLASVGVAAAGAAIALGVQSVQAFSAYQQSIVQLQNTTGSSDAQMRQYTATIAQLSNTTGKAQTDLAAGMYQIISANFAGADASRILATATRSAIIANADQTQVTTGLVVTLNAFGLKASQVDVISNQMFKTLSLGRGNMSDLAGALQTGGALVAHYGVSVKVMDATLATLSTGGMKTFGTSMTGLTQLLNVMDGKTDLIAKRMQKLGIPFDEARFKAMSFQQQVEYLNHALENNKGQEVAILGSKQAATALSILGTHADLLKNNIKALGDTQQLAKDKQDAWARTQQTSAFQAQLLQTHLQNLMITLGAALTPAITSLMSQITPLISSFTNWLTSGNRVQNGLQTLGSILQSFFMPIFNTLKDVVMNQVVPSFRQMWANIQPLMPTLMTLGKIIGTIIVGDIMMQIRIWGQLISYISGAVTEFSGIVALLTDLFTGKWSNLGKDLQVIWKGIVQQYTAIFGPILGWIGNLFSQIGTKAHQIWDGIVSYLKGVWDKITGAVHTAVNTVVGWFKWLYDHNTYFHMLVDKIHQVISAVAGWLKTTWEHVTKWLGDKWSTFKDLMGKAWEAVSKLLSTAWNNYVSKPMQDIWNSIVNFANGWPKDAVQWGINLIQGFINGLMSMLGKVKDAAGNIMKNVASVLGFHSPAKEGEGRFIIQWGTGMVEGFASGMLNAIPTLQTALNTLTLPMAQTLGVSVGTSSPSGLATSVNTGITASSGPTVVHNWTINLATLARNPAEVARLVDMLETEIADRFRLQTSGWAQSGIF